MLKSFPILFFAALLLLSPGAKAISCHEFEYSHAFDSLRFIEPSVSEKALELHWQHDDLLNEALLAEDTSVVTEANEWYEVEVTYGAADIEVRHAKRGNNFPETPQLTLEGLTVTAGSKVGFGVGTDTDFAFDNLITTEAAVDLVQASLQYDALGRRIAKSEYLNGVHQNTTYFYYDGDRIIEERDGNTGAVEATYVYGNYVDEVLQMQLNALSGLDEEIRVLRRSIHIRMDECERGNGVNQDAAN